MMSSDLIQRLRPIPPKILSSVVQAEICKRDLYAHVEALWPVHHDRCQLIPNWHMRVICDHLQAVYRGEIRRLIINVCPGFSKSLLVSVYFPTWIWAQDPSFTFVATSSTNDVVFRDARRCHEIVDSEVYRGIYAPEWGWKRSQDAKGYYVNTRGGARFSRSTLQKVIGLRADGIIVDDPLDARDAHIDRSALTDHVKWFRDSLSTRVSGPGAWIVVIMQRLHELDLTGYLLNQGGWDYLCLPNEYDGDRSRASTGWTDPRKTKGALLFPAMISQAETDRLKSANGLGSVAYACQYQQRPAPAEGAVFRESWLRFYDPGRLPDFDLMIGSWDPTAGTTGADSDYIVGQVWGCVGAERYLVGQVRFKGEFTEILDRFRVQRARFPRLRAVLVEGSALGPAIIAALQKRIPGLVVVGVQGESKLRRALAITPLFEAGQIFFPDPGKAPWVRDELLPEVLAFPGARHDDQVDAMTQALNYLAEKRHSSFTITTLGR